MKGLLICGALLSSVLCAEGKPPEFWCRAEPVSPNGDDYIEFDVGLDKACSTALLRCSKRYGVCEVTGCGEWNGKFVESFSCEGEYGYDYLYNQ